MPIICIAIYCSNTSDSGVHGWARALSMSNLDDNSPAIQQWCEEGFSDTPIKIVSTLSSGEATAAAEFVHESNDNWIHMDERAGGLPVFMFGTYWQYLSFGVPPPTRETMLTSQGINKKTMAGPLTTSRIGYEESVSIYNRKLRGGLQWMYDIVQKELQETLNAPVIFAADEYRNESAKFPSLGEVEFALPGFNILFPHRMFELEVFQAHIDGEWHPPVSVLEDAGSRCDPSRRITFTLPIEVGGSENCGLDVWEVACSEGEVVQRCEKGGIVSCLEKRRVKYTVGEMIVHDGRMIHAIGAWGKGAGGDDSTSTRMTLQGFSAFCDGVYVFFF